MSSIKSLVDAEGNINANYLTKELQEALEADVKFKQTDNMKKRAVKVSTDYNEFKNMVAAAHLKKLTSKEVESLSHVKKGWQKTVAHDNSSSAIILQKEFENDQLLTQNSDLKKAFKLEVKLKPKSAMEVERDLRRIPDQEEKLLYLYSVGLKRMKTLLAGGGDTDLLEQIVKLLCLRKAALLAQQPLVSELTEAVSDINLSHEKVGENSVSEEAYAGKREATEGAEAPALVRSPEELLMDYKQRARWLRAISEFDKFDLMVQFSSQELLRDAADILASQTSASAEAARQKFNKGIKS